MANSSLQGKGYSIPFQVLQALQSKAGQGDERVTALLNNPTQSYEQVKKLKHDIESGVLQGDWSAVATWANGVLSRDRNMVDNQKRTTMEIGMENRFRKPHDKSYGMNVTPLSVNETKIMKIKITEEQEKLLKKELIAEGEDFARYKAAALREMRKEKMEHIVQLKQDIKEINALLNKRKESGTDEVSENKKK